MRKKLKIIVKAGRESVFKIKDIHKKDFYKGISFPKAVVLASKYPFKHGHRATVSRIKKEIIEMANYGGLNHHFPNGVVSGVEPRAIAQYQPKHKVTIVIPSYNDYDLLKVCVKSIHDTSKEIDYKIIIIDDFCEEPNRKKLKTLVGERTRIIFRESNGGFSKAVNTGLREVPKTHDVVILNSDIVAHCDWLKALQYAAYEFGDRIGIVGPKLLYPDGRIQSAGSYRNTEDPEWFDHYYRFQDSNYGPANVPHYCLGVTGACQYITREFLDNVGILDEKFPFAFEDMDLCLRGWEADYKTLYFPASTLTHHESATRKKNKTISAKERASVVYFWEKWGQWFDKRNVKNKNGQTRVIYVLQTLGWSGGIKIAVEHANRLARNGFDCEIWSLDNACVWPTEVPLKSFKNYKALTQALSNEEAIKVATWWETAFPVWLASIKKGIAVNFIQEIESWFYPDDLNAQRTVISCYRKEFINLTTSSYNEDEIARLGLKSVRVPCGYDENVYYKLKSNKKENNVLLAVGRSFFQKNFEFTIRAWKRLGTRRPNMWLFGSEPDLKALDEQITYFTKPSDAEVNELYNKATVFVQTSRHEGFCLPLLEAMAAGTPIICTDAHGNRDFCINNKTCLMVEQDNDKQLTVAIDRLMNDEKLRTRLSRNGLAEAHKYTWDAITKQLVGFYGRVAQPHSIVERVKKEYGE